MRAPTVVQFARRFGVGTGVGSVAWHIERELRSHGFRTRRVSLETFHLARPIAYLTRRNAALGNLAAVVAYTLLSPIAWLYWTRRSVTISHNDCLPGDIFVNHGLLKPMFDSQPFVRRWRSRLLPLHAFLLVREQVRYRLRLNPRIVNFSQFGLAEQQRCYPSADAGFVTIPNGVDLHRFSPHNADGPSIRREFGYAPDDFVCVLVANEFIRKGLSIAIAAVEQCEPRAKLLVVGGSDAMIAGARESNPSDRVTYAGFQSDLLPGIYAAADVFVMPSAQEAWPLVLLEAMASGLPCVTTAVSSVPEIIQHGVNGYLCPREASVFAQCITQLIDDDAGRGRMAEAAASSVQQFSWVRIGDRYRELVTEVLEVKRGRRGAPVG